MEEDEEPLAPIAELRRDLSDQQAESLAIAEKAIDGIDSVIGAANFWLTALSVGLAILAVVGGAAVYAGARSIAAKVARNRVDAYLKENENNQFIREAIADEVRSQLKDRTFVMVDPIGADSDQPGQDGFARRPARGGPDK